MAAKFTELVVDANDPAALAEFWSAVLGWPARVDQDGDFVIADPSGSQPTILFNRGADPKTVKNRLHIDVNPVGCDQDEELARLVALGARHVDIGQGDESWVVLADPEGNEFCLLRGRRD
jgi:predicted enzyme related to lactoylglutathione lyase